MVDLPADSSASIPPTETLLYESPDLTIKFVSGSSQGVTYLAAPGSEELGFAGYDTVDPPLAAPNVTETIVPAGNPQAGSPQFVVGAGMAIFDLSSATGAISGAFLEVDVGPGGPSVALTQLGPPNGGISLGFDDPIVDAAFLSYGIPLAVG